LSNSRSRFFFFNNGYRAFILLWKRFLTFLRNLSCQSSFFRRKLTDLNFSTVSGFALSRGFAAASRFRDRVCKTTRRLSQTVFRTRFKLNRVYWFTCFLTSSNGINVPRASIPMQEWFTRSPSVSISLFQLLQILYKVITANNFKSFRVLITWQYFFSEQLI